MREADKRRPVRLLDNETKLLNLLASLDHEYPNLLIVVEGHRDEAALRNAGVNGEILRIHAGDTIAEVVDRMASRSGQEILILTDFDREGTELCHRIERSLENRQVRVLQGLRLRIHSLMGNLRCIEEIVSILKKQEWRER